MHRMGDDSNTGEIYVGVKNGISGNLAVGKGMTGEYELNWEIRPGDRIVIYVNDKYHDSYRFSSNQTEFNNFVATIRNNANYQNYGGGGMQSNFNNYPTGGSTTSSGYVCTSCKGTGICGICKGSGTYSMYGQTSSCSQCSASNGRKCSVCNGTGRIGN